MDWYVCDEAILEFQLRLVAEQLENTDFAAVASGRGEIPLALGVLSPSASDAASNAASKRHFIAPGTTEHLAPQNKHPEALMVAVTRLLTAACARWDAQPAQSSSPRPLSQPRLEALLGIRQQLLRGVRSWQHHRVAVKDLWGAACQSALDKAITRLESHVIELTEQHLAANMK
jgi:hypothetical protein